MKAVYLIPVSSAKVLALSGCASSGQHEAPNESDKIYGHPGYRYGIWETDVGDDSNDTVVYIDTQYRVSLTALPCLRAAPSVPP
jgi:hypothetical protein